MRLGHSTHRDFMRLFLISISLVRLHQTTGYPESRSQFINSAEQPLSMVYNNLPGQPGCDRSIEGPYVGMHFDIVHGQKSGGGVFADTVVDGGTQHIRVRFLSGTIWTRCG
jgi:hypothetical protein